MIVEDLDIPKQVVDILKEQGIEELFPPQAEATPIALEGKNLVLAVPTASGKSLVAYLAIVRSVMAGGKALYIVPLRAFEELGIRVTISSGDLDAPDPKLEGFDVIVATSEKTDSLLRHRSRWLSKISIIVADEVHLINDHKRGPTLEVILSRFRILNPKAQVLALSATIQNSLELALWLEAEHITSEWRPVVLKEGTLLEDEIAFTDNTKTTINTRGDAVTSLACDTVEDGGQAIIFVNTRRSTEVTAERVSQVMKDLLDDEERSKLEELGERFSHGEEEPSSISAHLASCIRGGCAYHHAGLTNSQRRLVETAFKERTIKTIAATPTLAAGINLPARRVIIRDLRRYDSTFGNVPLPVLEVKQMAGRAGRPRFDKEGEAVTIARNEYERMEILERYLLGEVEPITSKLGTEPALRMHILSSIATGYVSSIPSLEKFIDGTFLAHQMDTSFLDTKIEAALDFLMEHDFVQEGEWLTATPLGLRTSQLYIDPMSAVTICNHLEEVKCRKMGSEDGEDAKEVTSFSYLHTVCACPDMMTFYMGKNDYAWVQERMNKSSRALLIEPPEDPYAMEDLMSQVKTAAIIEMWMNEKSENKILSDFRVYPGDLHNRVEVGEWLLYSMAELAKLLKVDIGREIGELMLRVSHGVKEELLMLVRLKGIGRVRARSLFSRGFQYQSDINDATIEKLQQVPGIGAGLAASLKKQIQDRGVV